MACPLRPQCRHSLVLLVVLSAFLTAPAVAGEIFKCVAKDGGPLYQNFPCHLDSLGWLPSSPPVTNPFVTDPPVTKTPSTPGAVGQEKPNIEPINAASTVESSYAGEPRIGMTADEVIAVLGEPDDVEEDEPRSGGPVSIWRYADGRSVQFDHKHHVLGVQR